ncbi:tetraspanin-4-like [Amblyraja radiata]|uniref:tetraspanin-4-like n=1 Tax=Amblyraja radiata TaxID=386614 RepID=UPI001401D5D1|nr:tetraspanin-4-like [Amblyraja radiata]XP_032869365.1 tetraspanin-4-like [Amblyraja radiata]
MGQHCLQCMKYLLFIFNLIFWLSGCGILGVGVWLVVTQGNFVTLSSSFPSLTVANFFIAAGSVIMIVGFLGCIGAVIENRCLLLSFFVVLLIIFLLEMIVGILFLCCQDEINQYAKKELKRGLQFYNTSGNNDLTNGWDIVQTDFRCCGVVSYEDWFSVLNGNKVPASCCFKLVSDCSSTSDTWWKDPCYDKVIKWLKENIVAICIFGLCIPVLQIMGLVFSLVMYCQLAKAEKHYS